MVSCPKIKELLLLLSALYNADFSVGTLKGIDQGPHLEPEPIVTKTEQLSASYYPIRATILIGDTSHNFKTQWPIFEPFLLGYDSYDMSDDVAKI